jgi:predicted transcriptional regulator of viral defense system
MRDQRCTRPDGVAAARAAEQWGVLSVAELHACGLSKQAIARRVARGRLHPIHRGVYAVGHAGLSLEARFLAAVKACGETAVLSHGSAAVLWDITGWDERYPDVTVAQGVWRAHPGIRVHRSSTLARDDVARRRSIPVTTPARTLIDLAGALPERALRRAVRQAQSLHLTNVPQLARALQRPGPRRGIAALAQILATGPAPTRSVLEDVVLDLILGGGLQHPDVNVPLTLDGRRVVPDFRWSARRLAIEADGAQWHDHRLAREDDAERQTLLERHGERVLRVTWAQAVGRPNETLARMRAAGAPAELSVPPAVTRRGVSSTGGRRR